MSSPWLQCIDTLASPTSQSLSNLGNIGWTVGKTASGSYATASVGIITTTFGPLNQAPTFSPVDTLVTGSGWVIGPFTGHFIGPQTMSFNLSLIAASLHGQQGKLTYFFYKASDAMGTTPGFGFSGVAPNPLAPQANAGSVITMSAGPTVVSGTLLLTSSLVMNNEWLYLSVSWGIVTAGSNNASDITIQVGSGSFWKTGPFEDNSFILSMDDGGLPGFTHP